MSEKNDEIAYRRTKRNRKYSYILMVVFALVMIGGLVMLIKGLQIDTSATTIDAVAAMAGKIVLCVIGGLIALTGLFFLICAIVMAVTKFEGNSRNPINNFFKDTVSEFQDMIDETGETLAPRKKDKKICPECGHENSAHETICTKCGGGLGE